MAETNYIRSLSSQCVPESIANAKNWLARTGQPVKIAISKISDNIDHAQAVAFDGDKMTPLTAHEWDEKYKYFKPIPWSWHFPDKKPYRFIEVDEFLKEQEKNIDPDYLEFLKSIK